MIPTPRILGPFANSALTLSILGNARVVTAELMATLAMRLHGIQRRLPQSAQQILPLGNWFKVIRVDASPVAAEVIKLEPVWHGSD